MRPQPRHARRPAGHAPDLVIDAECWIVTEPGGRRIRRGAPRPAALLQRVGNALAALALRLCRGVAIRREAM